MTGPTFTPSGFGNTLTEVRNKLNGIPGNLQDYVDAIEITDPVVGIVSAVSGSGPVSQIVPQGNKFVAQVAEYLEELVTLPFQMWDASGKWQGIVKSLSHVESDIGGQLQNDGQEWTGLAAGMYNSGVSKQPGAVGSLANLASQLSSFCESVANATLSFLLNLNIQVTSVADSPDTLDPGWVLDTIIAAGENAATDLVNFHTSLDGFGKSLLNTYTIVGGSMPGGNWPTIPAQTGQ